MRLSELEPSFRKLVITTETWKIRKEDDSEGITTGPRHSYHLVTTVEEADGIEFLCPLCFKNNGNSNVGTHLVMCWRPKMPLDIGLTGPGRWELVGTNFDNLSLVANPTSVQINGGCNAHFTVSNGEIIWNG